MMWNEGLTGTAYPLRSSYDVKGENRMNWFSENRRKKRERQIFFSVRDLLFEFTQFEID